MFPCRMVKNKGRFPLVYKLKDSGQLKGVLDFLFSTAVLLLAFSTVFKWILENEQI